MPYSTRPYIPFTLVVPNPFIKYEIDKGKLKTMWGVANLINFESGSYSLEGADAVVTRQALYISNCGDITLRTRNGTVELKRLTSLSEFKSAVAGTLYSQIEEQKREEIAAEAQRRFRAIGDADLADYVIKIPALPTKLFHGFHEKKGAGPLFSWIARPGELIEQGAVVARCNVPDIVSGRGRNAETFPAQLVMPFDGKIVAINDKEHTEWLAQDSWFVGPEHSSNNCLMTFRPTKATDVLDAYHFSASKFYADLAVYIRKGEDSHRVAYHPTEKEKLYHKTSTIKFEGSDGAQKTRDFYAERSSIGFPTLEPPAF